MLLTILALSVATPAPTLPRPVTRLEATAQAGEPLEGTVDHLPLSTLPDDRLTVEVSLGDHGPFRFLVDTGADRTAVSAQLAERLGLPQSALVRMHSVTGASNVRTASVRGLRIDSRDLPDVKAPLLDAAHVRADGILGTDVLKSSQVRFDFKANLLSITTARGARPERADGETIVVTARRRAGRLIMTEATIDGQRLTVVLDTGSEVSIGNLALRRILDRRGALSADRVVELASVTGERMIANYMVARQLDIGGVTLTDIGIAFAEAHTFKVMNLEKRPALLLGMNAMRAFDSVTIDIAARKLRFALPTAPGGSAAAAP